MRVLGKAHCSGTLALPGDKSISHRVLLFSALSTGTTWARNLSTGDDVRGTERALVSMGINISDDGQDKVIVGGPLHPPPAVIDCGNSGTTIRLLTGLLAGQNIAAVLDGDASLRKRPMARILTPLQALGANVSGEHCPIVVRKSKLVGCDIRSPHASAQVKSAVILAALFASGETQLSMPRKSRDHTERMLRSMGAAIVGEDPELTIRPLEKGLDPLGKVDVPADPSSAAFFAAAAVITGGEVVFKNLLLNETRFGFFRAIARMGAELSTSDVRTSFGEKRGTLSVRGTGTLSAIDLAAKDIPDVVDELPILAIVAAHASGTSTIRGAEDLRVKESDRIRTVALGLAAMGADLDELDDGWCIRGGKALHGATIGCHHDHRIAMSFAIASLRAKGAVFLDGAETISSSFPEFFDCLHELRAAETTS